MQDHPDNRRWRNDTLILWPSQGTFYTLTISCLNYCKRKITETNTWEVVSAKGWDRKRRTDRQQPAGKETGGTGREEKEAEKGEERGKRHAKERSGEKRRGYRYSARHGRQQLLSPSVLPCHCPILLLLRLQDRRTGQTQTHVSESHWEPFIFGMHLWWPLNTTITIMDESKQILCEVCRLQ